MSHVVSSRIHDPAKSLRSFERRRAKLLLKYPGKFVLFCGAKMQGVYDNHEAALAAGCKMFPKTGFLLRKIIPASKALDLTIGLR